MTINQAVTSVAILEVNWETTHQDYISSFVPFVAQSILSLHQASISVPELQGQLLNEFGFEVPQNVLKHILKRAETRYKYVTRQDEHYIPNYDALNKLNFDSTCQTVLRKHNALTHLCLYTVSDIATPRYYCKLVYTPVW
ncbi:hypothetical protein ACFLXL_01865 [Chloroflexota bacterium]